MDHILNIQETIDENRGAIPTGVVEEVMRECQEAYKALPMLWKVHYVEYYAVAKHNLQSKAKTCIVEEDANIGTQWYWFQVLDTCRIPPADKHVDIKGGPDVITGDGRVSVIVKVEPLLKRARE